MICCLIRQRQQTDNRERLAPSVSVESRPRVAHCLQKQAKFAKGEQTTDDSQGEAAAVQDTDQNAEDQGLEGWVLVRDAKSGGV